MSQEVLHIVVVAGFNYSDTASNPHEFDERSMNRIGWYLTQHADRRETLVFHYLSVGHGVVARSVEVDPRFTAAQFMRLDKSVDRGARPGAQSFWASIDRATFCPVTRANYGPPKGGHHPAYKPTFDPLGRRPMAITDVYAHVATLPVNSVRELSIFSHSGVNGPILANCYESESLFMAFFRGHAPFMKTMRYRELLARDPYDLDARALKDFVTPAGLEFDLDAGLAANAARPNPNLLLEYTEAISWFYNYAIEGDDDQNTRRKLSFAWYVERCRAAFRKDAELWVWGCFSSQVVARLIWDCLASPEFAKGRHALAGAGGLPEVPDEWTLRRPVYYDRAYLLHDARTVTADALPPGTKKIPTPHLLAILRSAHIGSYASLTRLVLGVTSMQAFAGTSSDLEPRSAGPFPLMNVAAKFRQFVRFYDKVVLIDRWDRNGVSNTYTYSQAYPYAQYRPKR